MSTEYRRGIPSAAHVEAATRLGLLWRAERNHEDYWRFGIVGDDVQSVYDNRVSVTQRSRLTPCTDEERTASYRPICTDGTLVEPQSEPNRFDLLECDPKADPAVSIAAWEARQKRSTVRLMPKPQPQPQPLPAPCRLFEVVDAEAEGLRPGAVFTALLGRALNPNC